MSLKCIKINKNEPLGHGAYGAVYKAKWEQLPCAAKVLHSTFLGADGKGEETMIQRFKQECAFLESVRHPNIVQYLGMTMDPESRLPVLLMELLDESLTKMLERSQQLLPYCVQVDICHDIALAVAYLHSNDIIHRDLSSNNVLMIAGRRAKVTDFGMSKLVSAAPTTSPLTMCPGTLVYMAPEALREPPRYTKKLDCFSEGVIMIQVCTKLWPEPGPRTVRKSDPSSPTGESEIPVLEAERRKRHIELVNPDHPLLPIAIDCLNHQESNRPSSDELCQRLAALKEAGEYTTVLNMKGNELAEGLHEVLQRAKKEIRSKDEQIQEKGRALQHLTKKLEKQEQVITEIQTFNHFLQTQVKQLQHQLSQQGKHDVKPLPQVVLANVPPPVPPKSTKVRRKQVLEDVTIKPSREQCRKHSGAQQAQPITLEWRDEGRVPFKMREGVAMVDGHNAYFVTHNGMACSYNSTSKMWSKFPHSIYKGSSFAIVQKCLTAIGGCSRTESCTNVQNNILSLIGDGRKEWVELFSPMPTKRYNTTAVSTHDVLIVAGGKTSKFNFSTAVEVMDTSTLAWSTVSSLLRTSCRASATVCGDKLYMLGGSDDKGKTKSVLTCSLTELLQSSSISSVWHRVADAPAYLSTCAAANGELLAVGGCHEEDHCDTVTAAVYMYNSKTNSWNLISNMPTAKYGALVATLPANEIVVVGGSVDVSTGSNEVEIATIRCTTS